MTLETNWELVLNFVLALIIYHILMGIVKGIAEYIIQRK
jgi:hypothetical protein